MVVVAIGMRVSGDAAHASQSVRLVVRRRQTAVRHFPGRGRAVYSSASLTGCRASGIGGIAGETAATLGLFAKVKDCAIGLARNEAGVPRGSQSPAPDCLPAMLDCIAFMSGKRLNSPWSAEPAGTRIGSGARYIGPVVMCLELRHGLSPARSRRPDGRPAQAGRRLSARNLHPAARPRRGPRRATSSPAIPKAAYMSEVESWRELPGGDIEFTMRGCAAPTRPRQFRLPRRRPTGAVKRGPRPRDCRCSSGKP